MATPRASPPPLPQPRFFPTYAIIFPLIILIIGIASGPWLSRTSLFTPTISPTDYALRTQRVLERTPLIDGHNDLPYLLRIELKNKIYNSKVHNGFRNGLLSHTDITKLRAGRVGGQFWSVYVSCPASPSIAIDDPTWAVRDTLEQIDVAKRFIAEFPDTFQFCDHAACIRTAFRAGKIASMIGIEGGHQVGNSLANIRQMYELGARYITTTHNCDNAFATAASTVAAGLVDAGLTAFGEEYVREMNRLGMLIDLSHVSHQTMRDILAVTKAPIIFSHSSSYEVQPHLRNAPDDVLRLLPANGGIIMVTFVPMFLNIASPSSATVHDVVEHILHIAEVAGWDHIGLGSDFDGSENVPHGLEDVSFYPALLELLMERGATDSQIAKLAGENLIRVWTEIEGVSARMAAGKAMPNEEVWEGRAWERTDEGLPFMFADSKTNRTRIPGVNGAL